MGERLVKDQRESPVAHREKPNANIVGDHVCPRNESVPHTVSVHFWISMYIVRAIYKLVVCKSNKFPLEPALSWPPNAWDHEQDRNAQYEVNLDFFDHPETGDKIKYKEDSLRDARLNKHYPVAFNIAYHGFR